VDELEAEIREVVRRHDEAWCALDVARVADLWDADASPIYIGDEYREPVIGWRELSRHFGRIGGRLRSARWDSRVVAVRRLATDMALAVLLVEWTLVGVESDVEHHGHSWLTLVLRRTANGWRIQHQMEAPVYLTTDPGELTGFQDEAG
jgi:uncharacterized protein (TIGR02246 family)